MPDEIATKDAPLDVALAAFTKQPGTLVFPPEGGAPLWAHPQARELVAGADAALSAAVAVLVRDLRATRGTVMGQLPLAGRPRGVAARLVPLSGGGEAVVVVPLDWPFAASPAGIQKTSVEEAAAQEASAHETEIEPPPGIAEAVEPAPVASSEPARQTEPAHDGPPPELAERAAGRASIRFLWQTDAENRFTQFSPELAAIVGQAGADLVGRSVQEAIGTVLLDPKGDLAGTMARRETIAAYPVSWAFEGGPVFLRADLSGLPIFGPDRDFRGFRGFALLKPEDWHRENAPEPQAALAEPAEVEEPAKAQEPASAQEPAETEATAKTEESGQPDQPAARAKPVPFDLVKGAVGGTMGVQKPVSLRLVETQPKLRTVPSLSASEKAAFREIAKALGSRGEQEAEAPAAESKVAGQAEAKEPRPVKAEQAPAPAPVAEEKAPETGTTPAGREEPPLEPKAAAEVAAADEPATEPMFEQAAEPERKPAEAVAAAPLPAQEEPAQEELAEEELAQEKLAQEEPAQEVPALEEAAREEPAEEVPAREEPHPEAAVLSALSVVTQPAPQQAQILLEPIARRARDILDRIPVGVLVTRENDVLFANRTLLDLLDYASAADIAPRGGASVLFKTRPPSRVTEGSLPGAMLLSARDGETIAVDGRVQPIEWDGGPATLTTLRRSIEVEQMQRLKAQELDLRARETDLRELRSILDTATDGIIVLDDRGRILSINRTAEALFGYDQNEVAGEVLSILFAPESHAPALDYLEGLKSGGVRSVLNDGRDVTGRVRQGGRIPLFMTLGQISDVPDRKFCAVLRDLTAWKRSEAELLEAKRAAEKTSAQKSDFLAKISHEVRTPLNAIIGFAEVMMEERFGPVGNDRYREYLKDIHSSGGHVISLVNDLLDLSKIEAGRMEMNFASVNVNDVVKGAVSLIQPQAGRGRIVVRTALSAKLPPVVADERSLKQIVLNILSNAVKFTDAGGQVIVSSSLTDFGEVVIRVRDTGIGMTDEEITQALEPFRQVATSRMSQGTGLGLPLTKALVEANRSALRITSAKNEGTLVEVTFPPTRVLAE